MADDLPAISGRQLMRLLRLDGWTEVRRANHGIAFRKQFPDGRTRVTIVPDKRRPLATGTFGEILGIKANRTRPPGTARPDREAWLEVKGTIRAVVVLASDG